MTEGKFKLNLPKSIAISQISSFSVDDEDTSDQKEMSQVQDSESKVQKSGLLSGSILKRKSQIQIKKLQCKQVVSEFEDMFPKVESCSDLDEKFLGSEDNLENLELVERHHINGEEIKKQEKKQSAGSGNTKSSVRLTTSSQSLSMSRSRAKDELNPANFTFDSVNRLDTINNLFELKEDHASQRTRIRLNKRLLKKIDSIRILRKEFNIHHQISQQNTLFLQQSQVCQVGSSLILAQNNHIQRFSLDIDYFKSQILLETDSVTYSACESLNSTTLALADERNLLAFYDLSKVRVTNSFKTSSSSSLNNYSYNSFKPIQTFQSESPIECFKTHFSLENQLWLKTNQKLCLYELSSNTIVKAYQIPSNSRTNSIQVSENYILLQNEQEIQIYDLNQMNTPLCSYKNENNNKISKAIFGKTQYDVHFFYENSEIVSTFNTVKQKIISNKKFSQTITDILFSQPTSELLVLTTHEKFPNLFQNQIHLIQTQGGNLRNQVDLIKIDIPLKPIKYLQLEPTGKFLYGINGQCIKALKFFSESEVNIIKENLRQIAQ